MMMKNETSEALQHARNYETEKQSVIPDGQKPSFHVTPKIGWMNDPNGFSIYQEEVHLFFQYHPYSTKWGPMHWGHVKTKDFIKWEEMPCALAPDTAYDHGGCFSGNALAADGKHILMYTGVCGPEQVQGIAVGDGRDYEKMPGNPVIRSDALPEGSVREDFRDPKIWKEGNTYYALVGSRNAAFAGQLALFSSADIKDWQFERIFDEGGKDYGTMWECPDFFPMDGKQVLIVSPQYMRAKGLEFHNGNNSLYFVGDYEGAGKGWKRGEGRSLDYGLDFYAPQTIGTPDGRRILIGWMQSWDNYLTPEDFQWSGMMTIPRELTLANGKIRQLPVRELEHYRTGKVEYHQVPVAGEVQLTGIRGRNIDLTVTVEDGSYSVFTIKLAAGPDYETRLVYDRVRGMFTTDRTYSGGRKDLLSQRSMYVKPEGKIKIRILMDLYALEVFVNDGEQVMTSLLYTPVEVDGISFLCDSCLLGDVIKYEITAKQ